jgi:hypothetical protein
MVQQTDTGTGGRAAEYTTPADAGAMSGAIAPRLDINTAVVTPTDRVRWGPIIAGLFAALSTLAVLNVLGLAIGLSAYDPGDRARNFNIGAGIWGGVSALIAFFLGGWLAARTAAVGGHRNGILNGAMVWAVAIPLMLYLVATAANSMANTASNLANSASSVASAMKDRSGGSAGQDAGGNGAQQAQEQAQMQTQSPGQTMSNVTNSIDPQQATRAARRAAWGTLASLVLGLAAAAVGGHLGARSIGFDDNRDRSAA